MKHEDDEDDSVDDYEDEEEEKKYAHNSINRWKMRMMYGMENDV